MKRKTHDEYVAELAVKNPGVTVVGEYVNANTPIEHLCPLCDSTWKVRPALLLLTNNTKSCPSCAVSKRAARRKKTHAEYLRELFAINKDIRVLEDYQGTNTKIKHSCPSCGNPWLVAPCNVLRGHLKNCWSCRGNKKTHAEYVADVDALGLGIEVVGQYVNSQKKITHKCPSCDDLWLARPNTVLAGSAKTCTACRRANLKNKVTKTHEEYCVEVQALGTGFTVVGKYLNSYTPVTHRCAFGHEWTTKPVNIVRARAGGCPHCDRIASDANVAYLWENTQDPGIYKVGITSERCAEKRIKQCAGKNNMTPRIIMMLKTPHARDIERRALELGDDPRYPSTIDGYTEFRRYSDAELGEVWRMAVGA